MATTKKPAESAADRIVGNAIIAGARGEEIIGLREEPAKIPGTE